MHHTMTNRFDLVQVVEDPFVGVGDRIQYQFQPVVVVGNRLLDRILVFPARVFQL